jgi:chromosome segregation ATPase
MWGKYFWGWLPVLLLASCPVGLYGEEPAALPSSELLRRAVELSRELRRLNTEQVRELSASRELSERLQNELEALRNELSEAQALTGTSQAELTAVSDLLRTAREELTNLKQSWESLSEEAKRADRRTKVYRWAAIAGLIIGGGGIVYGLCF